LVQSRFTRKNEFDESMSVDLGRAGPRDMEDIAQLKALRAGTLAFLLRLLARVFQVSSDHAPKKPLSIFVTEGYAARFPCNGGGDSMRQVPGRVLWLGNAGDLRDARAVMAVGVSAVVELADSEPFAVLPRELVRCRFPLSDGGDNPRWLLRLAADSVAAFIRAGVPVLVCCSAGMSRSVCVAAAGITLADGQPLADSLVAVVGSGPADVAPALLAQVQQAIAR
jgi:hypothetical protein